MHFELKDILERSGFNLVHYPEQVLSFYQYKTSLKALPTLSTLLEPFADVPRYNKVIVEVDPQSRIMVFIEKKDGGYGPTPIATPLGFFLFLDVLMSNRNLDVAQRLQAILSSQSETSWTLANWSSLLDTMDRIKNNEQEEDCAQ